jgi:integrase
LFSAVGIAFLQVGEDVNSLELDDIDWNAGQFSVRGKGERLSVHGVQYLLTKHRMAAANVCPSLIQKRVTVHRLRHTMAMDLLQAGADRTVIALWLGHESVETTQIYLDATLSMKEEALAKTSPPRGRSGRYKPVDQLLDFLNNL